MDVFDTSALKGEHTSEEAMKEAVRRHRRGEVASLLKDSNYSSSSVEQFVTACEQYDVIHVDSEILSHCNSEQKDRLLRTAVKLCIESSNMMPLDLQKCDTINCDPWSNVKSLLQASNYSSSNVEQFVTACETYGSIHVERNRFFMYGVFRSRCSRQSWNEVEISLQDNSSVEKFLTACKQRSVIQVTREILSHCSTQQLDRLLTLSAALKDWYSLGELLKAGCSHEKRVWAVEQACRASPYGRCGTGIMTCFIRPHVDDDFLSHCNTQQLHSLLTAFAGKGEWETVGKVLKAGGSHEQKVWVIENTRYSLPSFTFNDSGSNFERHILPHIDDEVLSQCSTELLDRWLTTVTIFRRWDIIDRVLRAGSSQGKRVWVIEQACLKADRSNFQCYISPHCDDQLHNQIVNNPQIGLTLLFSAVMNEHCPQRMVAEYIRLGFSTHQPPAVLAKTDGIMFSVFLIVWCKTGDPYECMYDIFASPFLLAVLRGMPVVAHMLYESGSCSYSELQHLFTLLLDLSDPHTEEGRKFLEKPDEVYKWFMNTVPPFLPYLREMGSTPRSLVFSCRLVISHCLTVGGGRERAVQELPLTDRMKSYLLFSDLTDPDYQPRLYGTMSAALSQQK